MDTALFCSLFFLAGAGVGALAISAQMHKVLSTAKAEFAVLRTEARAEITEAENAIRQVKKAL